MEPGLRACRPLQIQEQDHDGRWGRSSLPQGATQQPSLPTLVLTLYAPTSSARTHRRTMQAWTGADRQGRMYGGCTSSTVCQPLRTFCLHKINCFQGLWASNVCMMGRPTFLSKAKGADGQNGQVAPLHFQLLFYCVLVLVVRTGDRRQATGYRLWSCVECGVWTVGGLHESISHLLLLLRHSLSYPAMLCYASILCVRVSGCLKKGLRGVRSSYHAMECFF